MRRFAKRSAALAIVAAMCVPFGPALAATRSVKLPTESDGAAMLGPTEALLFPKNGIETKLPGPATDREKVTVGLDTSGTISTIVDVQRLVITGLGDFRFKVPGPAQNVVGLAATQDQPGLRRGSVLWFGFSPGRKVLAARMPLFPGQEQKRMPLRVHLSIRVGGKPLLPGATASGLVVIDLNVTNVSSQPVALTTGAADPAALAPALDAIESRLRRGARPVPGDGGVPKSVAVQAPLSTTTVQVEAPLHVAGVFSFPDGSVTGLRAVGRSAKVAGGRVSFDGLLGGGEPLSIHARITGQARDVKLPSFVMHANTASPSAHELQPPSGGTWARALSSGGVATKPLVTRALEVMWQTARLRQYDGYLGNPDATGSSATAYTFHLIREPPPAAGPVRSESLAPASALFLLTCALALIALLAVGTTAWSLS